MTDGRIIGRETTDAHGGETVYGGIKQAHAGCPIRQRTGQRQERVHIPQRFGGFGNAWGQFGVFHRAWHFRPVQLHTTDAQHRQNRDSQNDNPHATQPLQLLPIPEDGFRQMLKPRHHRGSGGGPAG